jgi:hypothetical protein
MRASLPMTSPDRTERHKAGLRIAAPATVGALGVLAQTQELSKTSDAGRLGERG